MSIVLFLILMLLVQGCYFEINTERFSSDTEISGGSPTDTIPPIIKNVTSENVNGIYGVGEIISLQVEFSENVFLNIKNGNTPILDLILNVSPTARIATYISGSGSPILNFSYTVVSGDHSSLLDYTSVSALNLGSDMILQDQSGNESNLLLPHPGQTGSLGANKNITINTSLSPLFSIFAPFAELREVPRGTQSTVNLNIVVYGLNVSVYKYKIGVDAVTDCSDGSGYSSESLIANPIMDNISLIPDGLIRLCVIGGDSLENWQNLKQASSAMWIKSSITPTNLSYSTPLSTYVVNRTIVPNVPINNNAGPFTYSISPPLLTGLVLNPKTGIISGTPTITNGTGFQSYTVTATSAAGSTDAMINIAVVNPGLTIDKPVEGETVPSYKMLTGSCVSGLSVKVFASADLILSSSTNACVNGSYAVGLTSLNEFGPRWVRVEQANVSLNRNFYNANVGINNNYGWRSGITAIVRDPGTGKIYVSGSVGSGHFPNTNKGSPNIVRLNSDGSLDTSFVQSGTGFDNTVRSIAIDSNGKILVGGYFVSYNGVQSKYIARLNSDGSLDTSFAPIGTGLNNIVETLAIDTNGKILVGGNFTLYNGLSSKYIARLNSDGSLDANFTSSGTGLNSIVMTIVIDTNGKIVVGGGFTNYNGTPVNYITRLNTDGSVDASFNIAGSGFNAEVYTLKIASDGKILAGGPFTTYNGVNRKYIARLNSSGTLDTSFSPTGTGLNDLVYSLGVYENDKILVGGSFITYNGIVTQFFTSLNPDGTLNTSFTLAGSGFNGQVMAIASDVNGRILIGGQFSLYNGTPTNGIIRLNSNASRDMSFNPHGTGFNSRINSVIFDNNGKLLVAGAFTKYKGIKANRIVRLNLDGTVDSNFVLASGGPNDEIESLAVDSNGKIIIGGFFTTYDGLSANGLARLNSDGSLDTSFTRTGSGLDNQIAALAIDSIGRIVVGGWFTRNDGSGVYGVVRLNSNGTVDTNFEATTRVNDGVKTLAVDSNGKIVIGGPFLDFDGTGKHYIARLNDDGTADPSFVPDGVGPDDTIESLAIASDGKILIASAFSDYGGTAVNGIARLNSDGSLDASFAPEGTGPTSMVNTMALAADGSIIVGGYITDSNGERINGIVKLNSDGTMNANFSQSSKIPSNDVADLAFDSQGRIFIAGDFSEIAPYLAVLESDGSAANVGMALLPAVSRLALSTSLNLVATNGSAPYVYSILSGGGSINSSTGLFTAPNSSSTTVVQVKDSLGT
jgi:uncharacterized delta-60 repeat protein